MGQEYIWHVDWRTREICDGNNWDTVEELVDHRIWIVQKTHMGGIDSSLRQARHEDTSTWDMKNAVEYNGARIGRAMLDGMQTDLGVGLELYSYLRRRRLWLIYIRVRGKITFSNLPCTSPKCFNPLSQAQ